MDPLVLTLVLLAAVLHAVWNALAKVGGDPLLRLGLVAGASSLCALPLLAFIDAPAPASWPFLACSVLVHQAYYACLATAYSQGDYSTVYPIARGTAPILVAAGGWMFAGESLDALGVVAILVVAVGLISLTTRTERRCCGGRPARFALLTAGAIACYGVADGLGGRASGNVIGYAVVLSALQGLPLATFVAWRRRATLRVDLARHGGPGALAGVLSLVAYGLVIWAMTRAPLGFVAALREVGVVIAALVGARLLHEPVGARRLTAAAIVAAGLVLLQASRAG